MVREIIHQFSSERSPSSALVQAVRIGHLTDDVSKLSYVKGRSVGRLKPPIFISVAEDFPHRWILQHLSSKNGDQKPLVAFLLVIKVDGKVGRRRYTGVRADRYLEKDMCYRSAPPVCHPKTLRLKHEVILLNIKHMCLNFCTEYWNVVSKIHHFHVVCRPSRRGELPRFRQTGSPAAQGTTSWGRRQFRSCRDGRGLGGTASVASSRSSSTADAWETTRV